MSGDAVFSTANIYTSARSASTPTNGSPAKTTPGRSSASDAAPTPKGEHVQKGPCNEQETIIHVI